MKKIIFDCDNTFGVPDCDVDDGLALLYLLGDPQAEVLGITATYGNSTLETVYETTKQMLRELGREDIPVKKGGEKAGCYGSEASRYLAQMAAAYPGELSILATGSLTNLKGACEEDPSFFDNICEIVLMGGITEPLVFEKKEGGKLSLNTKALFVAIGQVPNNTLFEKLVDLSPDGYIVCDENMKTKTEGLFVAGDCRVKKVRQLTTACGDGAVAATSASTYLQKL